MFSVSLSIFFCLDGDIFLISVCADLGCNMDGTLVTHLRYVQRGSLRARAPSVGGRARGGAGGRARGRGGAGGFFDTRLPYVNQYAPLMCGTMTRCETPTIPPTVFRKRKEDEGGRGRGRGGTIRNTRVAGTQQPSLCRALSLTPSLTHWHCRAAV